MTRRLAPTLVAAAVVAVLGGCAAPYDGDGELAGQLLSSTSTRADATPVVVDTDLAADDLVALAFLLRHPEVRVEAVTIAGTGLVGCDPGVDLVADLLTALDEEPVPVACGREEPGPGARTWPQDWRDVAAGGSGLARAGSTLEPSRLPAPELIRRVAAREPGALVVALGPMTNLADLAGEWPRAYARLAGIRAMAGSVEAPAVDGVAEWNVAADPQAFATVLAGPAPLVLVPEDAVPDGTPDALAAPVVAGIAASGSPKWWDLSTAASLVASHSGVVEAGTWQLDDAEPGRLHRTGTGWVRVVLSLDEASLEEEYARAFAG